MKQVKIEFVYVIQHDMPLSAQDINHTAILKTMQLNTLDVLRLSGSISKVTLGAHLVAVNNTGRRNFMLYHILISSMLLNGINLIKTWIWRHNNLSNKKVMKKCSSCFKETLGDNPRFMEHVMHLYGRKNCS
jgi:hypothetical protein